MTGWSVKFTSTVSMSHIDMTLPNSTTTERPNHRMDTRKMHWAPKLITLVFVVLALLLALLAVISSHGVPQGLLRWLLPNQEGERLHTAFPGVIPHDQNSLYEPHLKKMAEQSQLGWQVDLAGFDQLHVASPGKVTLSVHDASGKPVAGQVDVALSRVANSNDDRHVQLKSQGDGVFSGEILISSAGRWLIGVTVRRGAESYTTQRSLTIDPPAAK